MILHICNRRDAWRRSVSLRAAQRSDGSVDISKALEVNTEFDLSRQFWSFLLNKGAIPDPRAFIHPCPHMSFVWGAGNVAFPRERFKEMSAHHCFRGLEYSEDRSKITEWAPLLIDGRDYSEPFAATRIITGSDVDYGALTHLLVKHLSDRSGFEVHYNRKVVGFDREHDGRRRISVEDVADGSVETVSPKFVFHRSGRRRRAAAAEVEYPRSQRLCRFPVSGIFVRCDVDAVSHRHRPKVYGQARSGSPAMTGPHLDTRIIGGKQSLLFGPCAGFHNFYSAARRRTRQCPRGRHLEKCARVVIHYLGSGRHGHIWAGQAAS